MDGERLKKLRLDLNLSQVEFGILLGYKEHSAGQTVSDLETGRRGRMPPKHLRPLIIMMEAHGISSLRAYLNANISEQSGAEPNHEAVDNP